MNKRTNRRRDTGRSTEVETLVNGTPPNNRRTRIIVRGRWGVRLEEPSARNAHARVCEGGGPDWITENLNGHEAGNGGYSQGDT